MKFVAYEKVSDTVGTVTAIYQDASTEIKDQLTGVDVENEVEIPPKLDIPEMDAYLRINLETNELYYDYIAKSTFEAEIKSLKQQLSEANSRNEKLAEESTLNQIALMELHAMMLSLMPPEEAAPTEEVPAEDAPVDQALEETANEE
ncbi:hypothetical protein [Paenibacillus xylanilyticus]|uniref:Uncharacterized protein n=1 Tax=Paenibacillus xylanilyticus TaxID=248903 RepID=A0A7Y6BS65_9BACL|nr:hypothetical protein [Paenibacillus xylanilyticus]NUU74038.1 hypothetical protein [Paenibacillus xylanilyticus]